MLGWFREERHTTLWTAVINTNVNELTMTKSKRRKYVGSGVRRQGTSLRSAAHSCDMSRGFSSKEAEESGRETRRRELRPQMWNVGHDFLNEAHGLLLIYSELLDKSTQNAEDSLVRCWSIRTLCSIVLGFFVFFRHITVTKTQDTPNHNLSSLKSVKWSSEYSV